MSLVEQAKKLAPELTALKADLHTHPELSFQEYRTTALLIDKLAALGLEIIDLGMETGVVALLRGGKPGKAVALRADMDAIEAQEPAGPGSSAYPGIMHACGHDAHTACLYGAARLLQMQHESLSGDVVFLFQPAEEIARGAAAMLSHGVWEKLPCGKPDYLFGLHNRPELPCGEIAIMEGGVMSGKEHFEITLHGVAGHGGAPHKCVDIIIPAAAIVQAVQSIVSRSTDPLDALVCAVLSIHAGTPENFVPDVLTMTGAIRAHSSAVTEQAKCRLGEIVRGVSAAHGCTWELHFIPQVPPTANSPAMTALARKAAGRVVDAAHIVSPRPDMGSEDFAVFGQDVPSFFYWLGSGFPGKDNAGWHSAGFRTDDDALPIGAALLAESALVALEQMAIFEVKVSVEEITDFTSYPGWVRCTLHDVHGHKHSFVEKIPVVSQQDIDFATPLPQCGGIRCHIIDRWNSDDGQVVVRVSSARPDGVESVDDVDEFELFEEQVSPWCKNSEEGHRPPGGRTFGFKGSSLKKPKGAHGH